jgi:hypothetical protein
MKIKISIIASLVLILGSFSPAFAQKPYKFAPGIRIGGYGNFGLDGKLFIGEKSAVEIIATTRRYGVASIYSYRYNEIMGLYQKQNKLTALDLDGLSWYAGGGAGIGFYSDEFANNTLSLAAVAGVEYTFPKLPLTISLDWMPRYFISSNYYWTGFSYNSGGLRVAYTIGKE